MRRYVLLAAVLAGLSLSAFYPCLDGEFVSDDINAIVHNEHVQGDLDPVAIFSSFSWWGSTRGDAPGYRPLTTLTFAINRATAGRYRVPYHLVNVGLHALVSLLVYALALALGIEATAAATAAVLFCLLPIHTEAVCWIVGRAELLAAAGFCAALVASLRYIERPRIGLLAACCLAYLAALFSKENAIVLLPLPVLATWVLYPRRRPVRPAAAVTIALIVSAAVYLAVRGAAGPAFRLGSGDLLDNPLSMLRPAGRLLGALSVFGRYFVLVLWPHPLSVDYSYNATGIGPGFTGDAYTVIGAIVATLLIYAAWRTRAARPAVCFGLLTAAAAYSIVANFPLTIGTIMGERLVYLPTVGLCVAVAALVEAAQVKRPRTAAVALVTVMLVYLAVDVGRARAWQSPVRLFEALIEEAGKLASKARGIPCRAVEPTEPPVASRMHAESLPGPSPSCPTTPPPGTTWATYWHARGVTKKPSPRTERRWSTRRHFLLPGTTWRSRFSFSDASMRHARPSS